MGQALWTVVAGLTVAAICGITKLAFSHQEPYRRLFLILNDAIFILGLGYACGVTGFVIGSAIEAARQGPKAVETLQFSPWLFAPSAVLLAIWAVCYVLLVMPSKIGLTDE